MSVIHQERAARQKRKCRWNCGVPIMPRERYVKCSLTPNDNDIGNTGWWHQALHGASRYDCPDYREAGGRLNHEEEIVPSGGGTEGEG